MYDLTEVEWFKSTGLLNEIYQKTGVVFAFMSADGKQCHPWVKCRDFLHDGVRTQITGETSEIYGFEFVKGVNPEINLKSMHMLVSKNDLKTEEDLSAFDRKIMCGLKLLRHFEKIAKRRYSSIIQIPKANLPKTHKAVYLFNGPGMWVSSPFLISMYSFLIRLGDKEIKFKNKDTLMEQLELIAKSPNDVGKNLAVDNDIDYLRICWKHLWKIIEAQKELFTPSEDGLHNIYRNSSISLSAFHNYSGIVSLVKGGSSDKELNIKAKEMFKNGTK